MKTIVFDKNSWHLHIAETYKSFNRYSYNNEEFGINLCEYIRSVIIGLLIFILIVAISVSIAFYLVINPIIIASIVLITGQVVDTGIGSVGFVGGATLLIMFLFFFGDFVFKKIGQIYEERSHNKPDIIKQKIKKSSFLGEAYKSFKNKYCAIITFE